jgi:hypothetical protein
MRYGLLAAALAAWAVSGQTASAAEKVNLRVLYAGNPGSPRTKDFVSFLGRYFAQVGETNYETFKADEAKEFDVVVFDWTSMYPRDKDGKIAPNGAGINYSWRSTRLSPDFDRPAVLIGKVGDYLTRSLRLKIDNL